MSAAAAQRHSGLRALASAPTFPTEDPTQQLDHVLTDDPGLNVKEHHTPRLAISDHRPLVAHLHRDS